MPLQADYILAQFTTELVGLNLGCARLLIPGMSAQTTFVQMLHVLHECGILAGGAIKQWRLTMEHSATSRLSELEALLRRHPGGLSSSDLAQALGVDASTIRRDLARLASTDIGLRRRGRHYQINFHRAARSLRLTPDEVLALIFACRLLTRQQSERNPHAEDVMRKLADIVRDDGPRFAHYIEDAAVLLRALPMREGFLDALEILTQAWSEGRVVAVRYRNQAGEISDRRIHPYCIEPYGETNSCYIVGFDEKAQGIRTFRVDRILSAELTGDHFEIPATFNPSRIFSEAWGVVWRETPPQRVELRFFGPAATVVQESFWHPSQRVTPEPGGTCIVRFDVSEPEEMKRWICQWGADVEVLTPHSLREQLAAEANRLAERYAAIPPAPSS
jgi:predicted DNA-binding transcriptional regulator YafY